jgi:chitinase
VEGWNLVTQYPGIMGPYAHKGNQWVGFDDVDIAVEKAFYVAEEKLGGIMFWTIDNDDFRGLCSKTPYPLIESAKEAMYSVESSVKTKTSVEVSTSEQVRRTRLRLTEKELANLSPSSNSTGQTPRRAGVVRPPPPKPHSRQEAPRSLGLATSTTPAPPTTPSSGPGFQCRSEGFFSHPTSCKKYYWCLDTPTEGPVAHTFSCPKGLYFNQISDGCDFLRNVDCGDRDIKETEKTEAEKEAIASGAESVESDEDDDEEEDPKSLKNILELVKAAGGVEGVEKLIEEEERAKKKELLHP